MNVGLDFIEQIRKLRIKSPDPDEDNKLSFDERSANAGGGWIAAQLQKVTGAIQAGYHKQHNDDDTHGTITATGSVTERGRTIAMGEVIQIPIIPSNFTGFGSMTWTVAATTQTSVYISLVGLMLTLTYNIRSTSVGGTLSDHLIMTFPTGFFCRRLTENAFIYSDAGTNGVGTASIPGQLDNFVGNQIHFYKSSGNWSAAASNTTVIGQISFEIAET